MVKILLLMILCHIIDDFVLQPICLSNLKQKSWWEERTKDEMYKNDYLMALLIHSISWSIMIMLPVILSDIEVSDTKFIVMGILNTIIHFLVDNAKANHHYFNLICDQAIHFCQIAITFIIVLLF